MPHSYAVMGNPIEHSLSPIIHQLFAKQTGRVLTYEKIHINLPSFESQVEDFFMQGGRGLNITSPCKQRAFAMAENVTERCARAKAANTLWRDVDGLHADNTDGIGLMRDLVRYIDLQGMRILILGAGGAARGILAPLLEANPAQLMIANRSAEKAQALSMDFLPATVCSLTELHGQLDLIINATSINFPVKSLSSRIITPTTVCYDLAYQYQGATPFVAWAQANGCVAVDGLGMLVEQAAEAFSIWHGVRPDVMSVLEILRDF